MKLIKQIPTKRTLAITVAAAAAIAIGIVSGAAIPNLSNTDTEEYTSMAYFPKKPANVNEFVDKMDVIVVGRVTSVIGSSTINSYDEQDNNRNIRENDAISPALPITDYELTVEQVILGNNLQTDDTITLRAIGSQDSVGRYPARMQMPQVGDRQVYGLGTNPDGTYGIYTWWSRFLIDGDRVTHTDDLRKPVDFVDATEPSKFIDALGRAASEKDD